ncbi:MAG: hypothetical protein LBJ00_13700 [Planctomycetaceae bacterium]|nr:hypothetical protein [Planctomycetaceae bacterium]
MKLLFKGEAHRPYWLRYQIKSLNFKKICNHDRSYIWGKCLIVFHFIFGWLWSNQGGRQGKFFGRYAVVQRENSI